MNPRRDSVPGPARAGSGGHDPQGSMSGRGTGLPVSSACQAWRLVVLVTACTARVDRTTDRSSTPPPASAVAASVSPARVRQVDLEGERSPGRTVLASFPVSNPERTARTRRWSKALKRPTRPGRAEFRYFRPQGWGKRHTAAPGGPIDAWGMFAATSVVVEASGGCVEVGRAIGRPEPIGSAGASGVSVRLRKRSEGARRSVEPQEVQRPR